MKRLIFIISILAILFSAFFVYAVQTEYGISIRSGWNLVPFGSFSSLSTNGDIQISDFKYAYLYDINDKKYILAWRNGEWTNEMKSLTANMQRGEQNWVTASSLWMYSEKSGAMKILSDGPGDVSMFKLKKGWNFIYALPAMKGMSVGVFKGNCNIIKICDYQRESWDCESAPISDSGVFIDSDSNIGIGMVIKVEDDCTLGGGSSAGLPPALPN